MLTKTFFRDSIKVKRIRILRSVLFDITKIAKFQWQNSDINTT